MKPINHNAPVKCSNSIVINAKPEKVWHILTDINHWPNWQTDISKCVIKDALEPAATFKWTTGGATIRSTLHTVCPFSQFGWTGKTLGLYAIHNWTLTETNGQTTVVAEESMEGLLAVVFRKSFNENLRSGMQRWLDLLKFKCEQSL